MQTKAGLTDPLLFGLIMGMAGTIFSYFWPVQHLMTPEARLFSHYPIVQGAGLAILAAFTPFLIIVWLFVLSGMLHLFLLMVQGARSGFEATFRVVAYSEAPYIFLIIPFCGGMISWIWSLVLVIIGLQHAHQITGAKAAFAVFLPLVICCGLGVTAAALFMGAVAASYGLMLP
jgi:hypothetical protein